MKVMSTAALKEGDLCYLNDGFDAKETCWAEREHNNNNFPYRRHTQFTDVLNYPTGSKDVADIFHALVATTQTVSLFTRKKKGRKLNKI
jgi:hypothetical protein